MRPRTYVSGTWTAMVGPEAVVLLDPSVPPLTVLRVWDEVEAGSDVTTWLELLAGGGLASLPAFALVQVTPDGVRALLRGAVVVEIDGHSLDARDVATWREQLAPEGREIVVLAPEEPSGTELPVTAGVVRAARVQYTVTALPVRDVAPLEVPAELAPDVDDAGASDAADADDAGASDAADADDAGASDAATEALPVVSAVPLAAAFPADDAGVGLADEAPAEPDATEAEELDVEREPEAEPEPAVEEPEAEPEPSVEEPEPAEEPEPEEPEAEAEPTEETGQEPEAVSADDVPTEPMAPERVDEVVAAGAPEEDSPTDDAADEDDEPDEAAEGSQDASAPPEISEDTFANYDPDALTDEAESTILVGSLPQQQPAPPESAPSPMIDSVPPPGAPAPAPEQPPVTGDHDGETLLAGALPEREGGGVVPEPEPEVAAPPAYVLAFAHGARVELDRPVLVGRAPESPRFDGPTPPRLVPVPSPEQDISRTHAEIRVEGGYVVVTDLRSTNGTVVTRPGQPAQRLHPGEGVPIGVGTLVDLGDGAVITLEWGAGAPAHDGR